MFVCNYSFKRREKVKMKVIISFLMVTIFILSACGNTEDVSESEEIPNIINVQFKTYPEVVKVNEAVELIATVTQGNEKVEDADKVEFEIWKDGQEECQHEKVEAKHKKDGQYVVSYTFKETGTYFVYSHTTARSYHSMPKNEIQVP